MTGFEDLERGDIIWAADPLSEKGRPMLVLATPRFPTHGVQLITVLLSTKTYDEAALTPLTQSCAPGHCARFPGRVNRPQQVRVV